MWAVRSKVKVVHRFALLTCMFDLPCSPTPASLRVGPSCFVFWAFWGYNTQCVWFSDTWEVTQVRKFWPELNERAQAYIACSETLAQLRLAMLALRRLHAQHLRFVLHSASDNTSAEAGINKLFTTTKPLCRFLKLVASWSARQNVQLAVTHLAGEQDAWADKLSCCKLHRFANRMQDREPSPRKH